MPTAIISVWNAPVLKPATWRRRGWRINITRTAVIVDDCAADQTSDHACRKSTSDRSAIIIVMMPARTVVIPWRRTSVIARPTPIIFLRSSRHCCRHDRPTKGRQSHAEQKHFLHNKHLVLLTLCPLGIGSMFPRIARSRLTVRERNIHPR